MYHALFQRLVIMDINVICSFEEKLFEDWWPWELGIQ